MATCIRCNSKRVTTTEYDVTKPDGSVIKKQRYCDPCAEVTGTVFKVKTIRNTTEQFATSVESEPEEEEAPVTTVESSVTEEDENKGEDSE